MRFYLSFIALTTFYMHSSQGNLSGFVRSSMTTHRPTNIKIKKKKTTIKYNETIILEKC